MFCAGAWITALFGLAMSSTAFARIDPAESTGQFFCQSWQTEDGLPDNVINSIAQTPDGYLWLSTPRGLVRFDGFQFTVFTPASMPGLAHSQIHKLFVDRDGTLWIASGTSNLSCYRNGKCRLLTKEHGMTLDPLRSICQDGNGTIWVSPWGDLFCKVTGDRAIEMPRAGGSPIPNNIFSDKAGVVWSAFGSTLVRLVNDRPENRLKTPQPLAAAARSQGGLWVMVGNELHEYVNDRLGQKLAELPVESATHILFEDAGGQVWAGTTTEGLWRYTNDHFEHTPTSHGDILCIYQDRESNLWVGTEGGGLNKIARKTFTIMNHEAGFPGDVIVSLCQDRDDASVCTTRDGALIRWRRGSEPTMLGELPGLPKAGFTAVQATADGSLWAATSSAGLSRIRGDQVTLFSAKDRAHWLPNDHVTVIYVDPAGVLWIGSEEGLAYFANEEFHVLETPGLQHSDLRCLGTDRAGRLWLGDGHGAAHCWNGTEWKVYGTADGLPGDPLRCVLPLQNGDVWLATYGGGLACYHDGHFVRCASGNGLWDDAVTEMLLDNHGRLWCGTPRGLFSTSLAGLEALAAEKTAKIECAAYGRSDGAGNIRCAHEFQPRCSKAADGRLLFATYNGLVIVDPEHLHPNPVAPKVCIESVTADAGATENGVSDVHTDSVAFGAGAKQIDFAYTAPSFTAPEKVRFRHRIVGLDPAWSAPTTERRVTYYGIPAGDYQFEVKACNSDGVWNELGASAAFSVAAPIWQKWWFRLGILGIFTAGVILVVRSVSFYRLRSRLRAAEQAAVVQRERARIAQDMHDELGSTLTRIALLGDLAHEDSHLPSEVEGHVKKMTETARRAVSALDEIVWAVNPRNDTLARLVEYVGRFAVEFLEPAGVRCRLDLPGRLPDRILSAEIRHHVFLAIKETLHNVIKHSGANEVHFEWRAEEAGSEIIIEDNGRGFTPPPDDACADGLRNMQERMAAIGGACEVETHPGGGTRVKFRLPHRAP